MNALLPTGLKVEDDEVINLTVPSFFAELGKLLAKTPSRVIANYMFWRIHAFSVGFLTEDFRKRQLQYATALSGRQEQEARWKECVDIASGRFVSYIPTHTAIPAIIDRVLRIAVRVFWLSSICFLLFVFSFLLLIDFFVILQ